MSVKKNRKKATRPVTVVHAEVPIADSVPSLKEAMKKLGHLPSEQKLNGLVLVVTCTRCLCHGLLPLADPERPQIMFGTAVSARCDEDAIDKR